MENGMNRFHYSPGLNIPLIVDEIVYLFVLRGEAHLFFQIAAARYERGSIIMTSKFAFSSAAIVSRATSGRSATAKKTRRRSRSDRPSTDALAASPVIA
jgi:hypothetical protein